MDRYCYKQTIATRTGSRKLFLSPRSKKRQRRIALGSFEYMVDEDELKAFLEEKAKSEEVSY
jgi:hypothetical protein